MEIGTVIGSIKDIFTKIKSDIAGLTMKGHQVTPFGFVSIPIKGLYCVRSRTRDYEIVLGYIQKAIDDLSDGEAIQFSKDSTGNIVSSIITRNTGQVELNGTGDYAVRFNELESGIDSYNTDILAELSNISTAIAGVGGAYTPGILSVDISDAKVDNVEVSSKSED